MSARAHRQLSALCARALKCYYCTHTYRTPTATDIPTATHTKRTSPTAGRDEKLWQRALRFCLHCQRH